MKQLIDFLSEILQRVKSESPDFFKKIQWTAGIIATLLTIAIGLNSAEIINISKVVFFKHSLLKEFEFALAIISGVFGTSILPTKDKSNESAS